MCHSQNKEIIGRFTAHYALACGRHKRVFDFDFGMVLVSFGYNTLSSIFTFEHPNLIKTR